MNVQDFRKKIVESLIKDDALSFHKAVNVRLNKILKNKLTEMEDEMSNPETAALIKIQSAAKGYGGECGDYSDGVTLCTLRNKQAALEFSDWLEDCADVDTYEMNILHSSPLEGYADNDDYNIENITDDRNFNFEFIIYLNPSIVEYDPVEIDAPDDHLYGEELETDDTLCEVERVKKVNALGVKRIKMQCQRGFKWNHNTGACQKIGGNELANSRKAHRKAVITKKSQGQSFRLRVNRKTKKAMRFRKIMGIR